MKYRVKADGSLVTKSQLIASNSSTSLPKTWTASTLEFLGVDPVLAGPKPEVGPYEVVVADGAVKVEGNWTEAWRVQPMFVEFTDKEKTVVTVDAQIAAYEAQKLAERRSRMVCTARQARLALSSVSLLATVEGAISQASDVARIEWEYASTVERLSPLITELQPVLGLTDAQLDDLFDLAITL